MSAFGFPEGGGLPSVEAAASPNAGPLTTAGEPQPAARQGADADLHPRWLETALAAVSDFHYAFDLNGRFCDVDQAFAGLLRRPAADILGRNFSELGYPPELAATLQRLIMQAIDSRQPVRHETPSTLALGAGGCHEYVFAPVLAADGTVEAVAGAARDISACRDVAQALRVAHDELEQQVRRRTAELLAANQLLRESQQLLRHLGAHREHVKEEERKRIAREIHDELGQSLLALRIDVSRLQARAGNPHSSLRQRTGAALQQIDLTIQSVRSIINNLRPPVLDLGLHAAIEWQIKDFKRRSGIDCELIGGGADFDAAVGEERAIALFRVLQEALANIVRHARAGRATIELHRGDSMLIMKIGDDGVGMDTAAARKSGSFGLVGMRERISYLQGQLTIDSAPGKGTALTVSIPLVDGLQPATAQPAMPPAPASPA